MPSLSLLATPAPWHILAYGTLLGTTFFQSFVGGIVAFRCLPRPQFSTLQQNIFPVYFALQTALPAALVFTYPATTLGSGGWSAALDNAAAGGSPGVSILVMFLCGLLNAAVLGPATTKCMRERKHQETRDGKKSYDAGPHSDAMQRLNSQFSLLHGLSSLVNMIALGAMVWYGLVLAERLS
ncbi:hypothetical protein H2201_001605 [Coniosporium apollinis]|uniref:TMEM205-like domain-containing protein n=2 Tax=Coniosporium TaxID=2810619 RepID=A0ABQ9P0Q4_9PEZI|nr:hypothetical protein H2199_007494 [Cladosporium sp. JES 115]KAJ9668176.1 hypothetical protein H2201_001605 [Coniosporium apollinis]